MLGCVQPDRKEKQVREVCSKRTPIANKQNTMKKILLFAVILIGLESCLSTHGCVGKANHNQKVAAKLHKKRAKHRNHSNNLGW